MDTFIHYGLAAGMQAVRDAGLEAVMSHHPDSLAGLAAAWAATIASWINTASGQVDAPGQEIVPLPGAGPLRFPED